MCELSDRAKAIKGEYLRRWKQQNPDKVKANQASYWEKKAAAMFGDKYQGPTAPGELSEHAKMARRYYYAKRRSEKPHENANNVRAYWERRAERMN